MGIKDSCQLTLSWILLAVIRLFQFALGIAVCGLYGTDLQKAHKNHVYQDGKWVYAVVCGALGAFTAVLYMIPFAMHIPFAFVWDTLLFILWIALFGIFGKMYINENAEGVAGVMRMKNAVWVDLVGALLWLITAGFMAMHWVKNRHNRSRFTGRAQV